MLQALSRLQDLKEIEAKEEQDRLRAEEAQKRRALEAEEMQREHEEKER